MAKSKLEQLLEIDEKQAEWERQELKKRLPWVAAAGIASALSEAVSSRDEENKGERILRSVASGAETATLAAEAAREKASEIAKMKALELKARIDPYYRRQFLIEQLRQRITNKAERIVGLSGLGGLFGGAGLGAAIGAIASKSRGEAAGFGAILGAAGGTILGLIGGLISAEIWAERRFAREKAKLLRQAEKNKSMYLEDYDVEV